MASKMTRRVGATLGIGIVGAVTAAVVAYVVFAVALFLIGFSMD
jgi:hypothetical protein